jgi:hypothetical protein
VFALLALGSAVVYGAADFIGGLTSRRADTIAIVLISQAAGLGYAIKGCDLKLRLARWTCM